VGAVLGWNYHTNLTEANQQASSAQGVHTAPFHRMVMPIAKKFDEYMKNSANEDLKRIFDRLAQGSVSSNDDDLKKTSKLSSELQKIYSVAEVCESNDQKKCYTLSPVLEQLMQTEKDYDRLTWAWKGWHDQCGNKIRPVYLPYVDLLNKNVKRNGYRDLAVWPKVWKMSFSFRF
jgi:hypothetical protein